MSLGHSIPSSTARSKTFPWPNIPLLHLYLRGNAAALTHARRGQQASVGRISALSNMQAPKEAPVHRKELAEAPLPILSGDSKQAISAFNAAFADTFKRKQSARCLNLVFSYASSLPQRQSEAEQSTEAPNSASELSITSCSSDSTHVLERAATSGEMDVSSNPAGCNAITLSLRAKRHLSNVLKGKHQEMMKMLIADGNVAGAIQYLYLLPPDRQLCSCLMKECSAANDVPGLQMAIQARRALGMADDAFSFSALVTTAGNTGNAQLLAETFSSAQAAKACNVAVCNAAIEAYGRLDAVQAALDVFEQQMPKLGIQPDIITYNSLLRALGRSKDSGQSAAVMHLYDSLCNHSSLTPDKYTFSAVCSAAMHLKMTDGSFMLQVLSDTSIYGVPLNSRIMFTFLQACWGGSFTREQVARVFAEVAAMRAHRQPDQSVFAALLTFAQRHLPEHATDVWAALQEDSLMPNEHIYSALFAACAAGRTPDLLATAAAAEERMHQHWLSMKSSRLPQYYSEEGWRIAYNSLLNLHAKSGRADLAEGVYQGMLLQGPSPNKNTVNSTIVAFATVGNTNAAFDRFKEMALRGLSPDSSTFGALLHACAQVGKHVSAAQVLKSMRGAGFAPTVQAYTSYMDACVKANTKSSIAKAFQVFEQMQAEGMQASEVTYGCLLVACERLGDVDRAFKLYKQACQQGIAPSDECHNILVNVCTATGRLHEALELVKEMARSHRYMQAATLNSLVRALAPSSAARALRMVSFMTTMGLPTYHLTNIALVGACARQHLSVEASDLYWRLRKKGVLVTRSAGSDLIVALCKADQPQKALRVYHDMMASAFGAPGHLLPQSAAAEPKIQQDAWSTSATADAASSDAATSDGSASFDSTEAAHAGMDTVRLVMSGPLPTPEDPRAEQRPISSSASSILDDTTASPSADDLPVAANSAVSSPPIQPKPARRIPSPVQPSPAVSGIREEKRGLQNHPVTNEVLASPRRQVGTGTKPASFDGLAVLNKQSKPTGSQKKQPTVIPHVAALGALVGALARASDIDQALLLYKQVGRDPVGAQALTMSDRFMWQSLLEICCRKGRIAVALQVFDDWKMHVSHALERGTEADQLPRLSNVTLAFLEACCRADPAFEWRVFDVCAAMRQQSERKQQAMLARPRKLSHHFFEEA